MNRLLLLIFLFLLLPLTARAETPALRLVDFSGHAVALSEVQRAATLLAFWTASCVPCQKEMTVLQALHEKEAADPSVQIIGVNLDDDAALPEAVKLLAEHPVSYRMLRDPQRDLVRKWFPDHPEQLVLPTILVIDRSFHAVFAQGFAPDMSAEAFIAEWRPQLVAARTGALRQTLKRIETKTGALDLEKMAQLLEKMIRSAHPALPDADVKKRVEAAQKQFREQGRISIE